MSPRGPRRRSHRPVSGHAGRCAPGMSKLHAVASCMPHRAKLQPPGRGVRAHPKPLMKPIVRSFAVVPLTVAALSNVSTAASREDVPVATAASDGLAGKIHSDLERGFIRAEVIGWEDLVAAGSWSRARENAIRARQTTRSGLHH